MYPKRPMTNTECHNGIKIWIFRNDQFQIKIQFKKNRGFGPTKIIMQQ